MIGYVTIDVSDMERAKAFWAPPVTAKPACMAAVAPQASVFSCSGFSDSVCSDPSGSRSSIFSWLS